MRAITVIEAARDLGVSEREIEKLIKSGDVRVLRKFGGKYMPRLLSMDDLEGVKRRRARTLLPMRFKQISVLGGSKLVLATLTAIGLHPTQHNTLLNAVNGSHPNDMPIVAICRDLLDEEKNLLEMYGSNVASFRHHGDTELRYLARESARLVDERIAKGL